MGWVYVGYTTLKLTVIMAAHSATRWDEFLFRHRALQPLAWVLERLISTPSTHAAHHALSETDGIGRHSGKQVVQAEISRAVEPRQPGPQQQRQGLRQHAAGQQGEHGAIFSKQRFE